MFPILWPLYGYPLYGYPQRSNTPKTNMGFVYPYIISRTAPHGGVIFALKMVKNTGIYSVLWPKWAGKPLF